MRNLTLVGTIDSREVRFPLAEGVHVLGRGNDVGLRVPRPSVSRRHAELVVRDGEVTVRDLGSHNGTVVNGARIDDTVTLRLGDLLEVANLSFRVEDPGADVTAAAISNGVHPSAEISWDEARTVRGKRNLRALLFRVLAKAGDLLTIPRAPADMYEPILDLVDTALLKPERVFVLLMEDGRDEPVRAASRIHGRDGDALVLSGTMIRQVLREKKSFLTSDHLGGGEDDMMSMVSQGIRSAIAVPLFDNEDVIGILYADDSRPDRGFIRDQLAAFTLLANIIAVALTHARYHEMEEQKRRQDAQLATASEILDHMLPATLPALDGYDVLASLVPCFEVGGDLYDAHVTPDGRYAFLIGDVTGKGLGAALLVSHVLSLTRFMIAEGWEPEALVTRLNRQIFACTDAVRFATIFLGYLEPDTGRVTYVNAGHNPPFVVRRDGGLDECAPTGLPVGMIDDVAYGTGEVTLEHGDLLAVFSDGITETQRADDEEFGEERFRQLLVGGRDGDLRELFDGLQAELAAFRGEVEIGDDVTLVTVRRAMADVIDAESTA
jgi:sigma-B regulation protein RsbU (phosphoserine phosphatase)